MAVPQRAFPESRNSFVCMGRLDKDAKGCRSKIKSRTIGLQNKMESNVNKNSRFGCGQTESEK